MNDNRNREQAFVDAFELEELEERLEFRDWSGEASCETDFNDNTTCSAKVKVD